jgi:4-amino-4-deoxy-L-arabinose transferase-like glycosyltransferase
MPSASVPPSVRPPAGEVIPAEMEQDPDLWLRVAAWVVIAISIAQVLVFSFGQDQAAYGTVARGLLQGQVPYRDLWSPHPPGIFFVFATAFALFGENMAAPRLLEALCLVGVVLSCRRLGGVFFGSRTGGLLGGATACLVHAQTDFWHTAQPGSFGGALVMFALVATTHDWSRRRLRAGALLAGLLVGLAGTLEPTLGITALPLALYLVLTRRRDGYVLRRQVVPALLLLVGALVPWALLLVWFASKHALGDLGWALSVFQFGHAARWVEQSAPHLLYQALKEALFEQSALVAAGVIAAVAVHPRATREKQGLLLLASILALDLAGVAFRSSFEERDFAGALPFLSLVAGLGLYKLWRRIGPGSLPGTLAFAALLLVLPLMRGPGRDLPQGYGERSRLRLTYLLAAGKVLGREELDRRLDHLGAFNLESARAVSRYLDEKVPPGQRLLVSGNEPILYFLSRRLPVDRFVIRPDDAEPELGPTTPGTPLVLSPSSTPDVRGRKRLAQQLGPPTHVEGYTLFLPDPR